MIVVKLIALLLSIIISNNEAAKILALYPCLSISHQVVFRPITLELIKQGHDVTVLTPFPMFKKGEAPKNLREIDVLNATYGIYLDHFAKSVTGSKSDLYMQFVNMTSAIHYSSAAQMNLKEFKDLINDSSTKYDLIFVEALYTPFLGISHVFKAPIIMFSSFGPYIDTYDIIGSPSHPFLYHHMYRQRLYNLTSWEKVSELYMTFRLQQILNEAEDKNNRLLKDVFGPNTPDLSVLKSNVDMVLLNIHPIWEGNYPVPPNVIYVGGLHLNTPKELPRELKEYLDNSTNGVIYFSFGSNVRPSMMPQEKFEIFKKVFAQLPYNVIWKWDTDDFKVDSPNVKIHKWLPQSDLLRHPNVKVFITQGGLQSTDEAITGGVPLIAFPMLGDQWYNAEKYEYHKIGIKLDFENLTEDKLKDAITKIVEDKSYKDNVARLRSLMQDQAQPPLERAMWWINYVIRHGGAKHLKSPSSNLPWTEYYEIELLTLVVLSLIIVITLVYILIRYLYKYATVILGRNLIKMKKM
ncbi:PREDICTED: UDP-glucuronosyltransferase 2B31-like [Papilio xuthus]|uniref:UDP-glucuronosyltransferase n=1 Tax=Papilio xuthus TaxID=66420 RepID=A0AAJ6ZAT4_PAPXU|nr:PREDICTED: UDP-glucuronosyltransferase 2B31-like [Papilio xuthus]